MTCTDLHIEFSMPDADYRAAGGVNISSLNKLDPPARYKACLDQPKEPTKATEFGKLQHGHLLLGQEIPVSEKGADLLCGGALPKKFDGTVNIDTFFAIRDMSDMVQNHAIAGPALKRSRKEVSAFARDTATGLLCKGRADAVAIDDEGNTVLLDIKTVAAGGASRSEFSKQVANFQYHCQAAWYLDLFGATDFIFVAVEKEPPFLVACYMLGLRSIQRGRETNARRLATLATCLERDEWPGYSEELEELELPEWALK